SMESNPKRRREGSDESSGIQDCLSILPNDCIFDVFNRLDQNDLDEMSKVSKRNCSIAAAARSRALSTPNARLLMQQRHNVVTITLFHPTSICVLRFVC
ncbi:hypothetical protein PMAYCL1PPCAC_25336, partial [Pristionchus mayeri]